VFLRDYDDDAKRVSLHVADRLVADGLADRVSAAGHVRLKPGLKIKTLDLHRGARSERNNNRPAAGSQVTPSALSSMALAVNLNRNESSHTKGR
jgi:hypothetical protein